jgi:DNA-binding transcriptional LysR family regulator
VLPVDLVRRSHLLGCKLERRLAGRTLGASCRRARPDSRVDRGIAIPADTPSGPVGSVAVVEFTLVGQQFTVISAGPLDPFNHVISFLVTCTDRAEIDRYLRPRHCLRVLPTSRLERLRTHHSVLGCRVATHHPRGVLRFTQWHDSIVESCRQANLIDIWMHYSCYRAMDTELAKTFLEIVSSGSFVRAAEGLNVGQTTVSARIKLLEQQLGRTLFVRNKAGATLTPAGKQFLRYAPSFVQLWQTARHQVGVPAGHRAVLVIGSEVSLWQPLLFDWVTWMRRSMRDIALRVHVDVPQDLINHVASGFVDVAIMYAPQHRPGLQIDLLLEETLVLVTTDPKGRLTADVDYIHVDWGSDFALHHERTFPDITPNVFVNLGPLGLNYVLQAGGAGYFRMRAVQPYIAAGRLHVVPGMPHFSYPIYSVQSASADAAIVGAALTGLRAVSATQARAKPEARRRRRARGSVRRGRS